METLEKNCPFCGHKATLVNPPGNETLHPFWSIICSDPGCKLHYVELDFTGEQEAKIFWNHRVS